MLRLPRSCVTRMALHWTVERYQQCGMSNINEENRQARTGVMLTKNWTFQQDWAPAHGAKTTVELNREQFPDLRQRHLTVKLA
uniref:Transposase n=1 Tax=Heterorhabditis bacteriophora TaxID=37862 RepID=A0A1I7XB59_HETBA